MLCFVAHTQTRDSARGQPKGLSRELESRQLQDSYTSVPGVEAALRRRSARRLWRLDGGSTLEYTASQPRAQVLAAAAAGNRRVTLKLQGVHAGMPCIVRPRHRALAQGRHDY